MEIHQPGFLDDFRTASLQARNAQVVSGDGNSNHTAVQAWGRFTVYGLHVLMLRPLDPLLTTLSRRLQEVDLIECFAWYLITYTNANTETAWQYVGVLNRWHERATGVPLAAGMPLDRVHRQLQAWQLLLGRPILRRRRIGVRPRHLRAGISAALQPARDPHHANLATLMEVAIVAVCRAGELAAGRHGWAANRLPTRADVSFVFRDGRLVDVVLQVTNCKARGAERFRKFPKHLPVRGRFLSPGQALYQLVTVLDPVPDHLASSTPLFRNPLTGAALTVAQVRAALRSCMAAIGLDASQYGAHSLRIGGATALASLDAPSYVIQRLGHWSSDAYLRYLRESRSEHDRYVQGIADADVDDFTADYVAIDDHEFDDDDDE